MNHKLPSPKIMYSALLKRDSSYEGIFIVGVKTTGIFCRPTCTARKPKYENVEFFQNQSAALQHGYRPCKICRPMEQQGAAPDWLHPLLEEVQNEPGIRLRDSEIRDRGLDPNRVRRWFKQNHGMTFQCYLRTLRIGQAFGRIRYGEKVIDSAFDSGYESLSGFAETFKNITGFSPNHSKSKTVIVITRLLTPLGPMLAGANDDGICLLEFVDRRMLETQLKRLNHVLKAICIPGDHPLFEVLDHQLAEYFRGQRQEFDLALNIVGTPFQKAVWNGLRQIPYGTTRSYQEQAEFLGNLKAVRAVARANGDNRIGIVIPCHRVIGKDGKLVGYGGGLWRKKYLLELESRGQSAILES